MGIYTILAILFLFLVYREIEEVRSGRRSRSHPLFSEALS